MKKKLIYILILAIFVIGILFYLVYTESKMNSNTNYVSLKSGAKLKVELAKTNAEHERGLMYRENLDEDSGMLFIFDNEKVVNFWMKNTIIPLDMIFLDSNKKIVHIEFNAIPCNKDPCKIYPSIYPVKYVIEVNSGYSEKNNINVGDKLEFNSD